MGRQKAGLTPERGLPLDYFCFLGFLVSFLRSIPLAIG